ncbi:MAG TPA: phosphotransferase, partial [Phenylobacterium sp.]
ARNAATLLHGDFWPGNVLWDAGRIAAVIDWEEAAFGDPLHDLGISRLDMLWAYGEPASQAFTAAYAKAAPHVDLAGLPWFDLAAALRPAGQISRWAAIADDPREKAQHMRERHALFRDRALASLG